MSDMTTTPDDGGPAFPVPSQRTKDGFGTIAARSGMTLRDWFAAAALTGMAGNSGAPWMQWKDMATGAYAAADAMLAERAKRRGA